MMRVTGYHAGVSYSVECDPSRKSEDPLVGVVTHASPRSMRSLMLSIEGEEHRLTPEGRAHVVSMGTTSGVLAALMTLTEITAIVGDDAPSEIAPTGARSLGTVTTP